MEKGSNFKQILFCIKYDLIRGILKRFYWYIAEMILFIVIAADS